MVHALNDRRKRDVPARRESDRMGLYTPMPQRPHLGAPPPPDDGFEVSQLWALLRDNVRLIVTVSLSFFILVMAATLFSRMQFKSSGRLYLGELEGKNARQTRPNDINFSGDEQVDLGSEIQILQSESLATIAVRKSGLNVSLTPVGWSAPRFWKWLLKRRDPQLLDAASAEIRASETDLNQGMVGERHYKVKFTSDTAYQVWSEKHLVGSGRLGTPEVLSELKLRLDKGRERAPTTGSEYELTVSPIDETVRELLKVLAVTVPKPISQGESAKVVSLEFASGSPREAADFLRELMHGYLQERQSWKTEDASAAETFVRNQLKAMRDSLDRTEKKVADYRSNTAGVVLDEEAKSMVEQIGKYEEQRVAARLQIAAFSDMKRALKSNSPQLEAFMFGEASDTVLQEQATSLAKAQRELTDLESRFSSAAPDVREKQAQVTAQLNTVRNYVTNRLTRAQESLSALNQVIRQFEDKLKMVPGAELGLTQLARESEVHSRIYSYLLEREQQAAIVKASEVSKNRILDTPQIPRRESSPLLGLRLASGLLGLFVGVFFVVLRSLFSSKLQSERDVRRGLGSVPVFASVPKRAFAHVDRSTYQRLMFDVLGDSPSSGFTESFRTLRTNLYRSIPGDTGKVVLVTSPCPGDGKTTTVLALATMLSADRKRVLVIDADLRKPTHHILLQTPQEPGLSNVLKGRSDWNAVLHSIRLSTGGFESVNSGSVVSAELLSSDYLVEFLAFARGNYDYILLDSPSFPMVSDALVLSALSDCVVSVMRLQNTQRRLAYDHLRRLEVEAGVYAVVVNGISTAESYVATSAPSSRGLEVRDSVPGGLRGLFPRTVRKHVAGPDESRWRMVLPVIAGVLFALVAALIVRANRDPHAVVPERSAAGRVADGKPADGLPGKTQGALAMPPQLPSVSDTPAAVDVGDEPATLDSEPAEGPEEALEPSEGASAPAAGGAGPVAPPENAAPPASAKPVKREAATQRLHTVEPRRQGGPASGHGTKATWTLGAEPTSAPSKPAEVVVPQPLGPASFPLLAPEPAARPAKVDPLLPNNPY